jgi:hypothetical protein
LFTETENVRWEPMNQVRLRARRRTIGQAAVVAGVVALALVSGGVAVAQGRQSPVTPPAATTPSPSKPPASWSSPSPSTPPSSTGAGIPTSPTTSKPSSSQSSPTGVSSAMMLRPQDVGSGYVVKPGAGGDWTFEFGALALGCRQVATPGPVAELGRTLRKGQPQDENFVLQRTRRYGPNGAEVYLMLVRKQVSSCSPDAGRSVRIAAQGFAGDESVLVVFDHGGGQLAKHVLVRKGDVLTEIFSKPGRSDSASLELGRKAAARI